jgi:heme exporter protein C
VAPSARRRRGEGRAPIGAAFTFLCLVTGSLWGRPMWGTYWVWDARLTSVLILFLMYLGVIALWRTVKTRRAPPAPRDPDAGRRRQPADHQVLGGLVEHVHQPASVIKLGGPSIYPTILIPLLVMALGVHAAVCHAAHRRHGQRNSAPPRPHR